MEEIKRFKAISGLHVASSLLIERLRDGKPGDILTDAEIETVCGHPAGVGNKGYQYEQTAIRYVRNMGIVWKRQHGEHCIKCLNPLERVQSSYDRTKRGTRHLKVSAKIAASVNENEIPELERERFRRERNRTAIMIQFAKTKSEKLGQIDPVKKIDINRTLEIFEKKKALPEPANG